MRYLLFLLLILSPVSQADEIIFSNAIDVTLHKQGIFHHIDSTGRKNIAATSSGIAIAWEDNRSGKPQVYMALKPFNQDHFAKAIRISDQNVEAYEPSIIALDNNQLLIAWEQNSQVWFTLVNQEEPGKAMLLDNHNGSQVTLTLTPRNKIYACWVQHVRPHQQIVVSEISLLNKQLKVGTPVIVDASSTPRRQSYPGITATRQGLAIGWEDREHGHTRIYTSFSTDGKVFRKKMPLNDLPPRMSAKYGRGTGATRVVMDSDNNSMVVASWMDKRNFRGGYDIFAAVSNDGGQTYGKDEIVQDMLGENQPQWHPAIAINNNGKIYVAWDDPRDDSADVWLSYRLSAEWSDDQLVAPASGQGQQANPAITYDHNGRLHMIWIDQAATGSRLRYAYQQ